MPYVYKHKSNIDKGGKELKIIIGIGAFLAAFGIALIFFSIL